VLSFAIQTAFSDRPNINGNEEKIQPHLYPTMKLNPTELQFLQARKEGKMKNIKFDQDSSLEYGEIKYGPGIQQKLDVLPMLNQADSGLCWAFSSIEAANILSQNGDQYDVGGFIKTTIYLGQHLTSIPYPIATMIITSNESSNKAPFTSIIQFSNGLQEAGLDDELNGASFLQYSGASLATDAQLKWMTNGTFYKKPSNAPNANLQNVITAHNTYISSSANLKDFQKLRNTNITVYPLMTYNLVKDAISDKYFDNYTVKNIKKALDLGYVVQISFTVVGLDSDTLPFGDGYYDGSRLIEGKSKESHNNNTWTLTKELFSSTLKDSQNHIDGGHAVLLVGYKEDPNDSENIIFEIRNSWGVINKNLPNTDPVNAYYITSNYLRIFMYGAAVVAPSNEIMMSQQQTAHKEWINNVINNQIVYNNWLYAPTLTKSKN